jgi:hypothetical protein
MKELQGERWKLLGYQVVKRFLSKRYVTYVTIVLLNRRMRRIGLKKTIADEICGGSGEEERREEEDLSLSGTGLSRYG